MKFMSFMIVVSDMAASVKFYQDVLGEKVTLDMGANVTLSSGYALQTRDSWAQFIEKPISELRVGGNNAELYYETDDLDGFLAKLGTFSVELVHPIKEHPWGQRAVRFYDPDYNMIEVAEPVENVVRRFFQQGMTPEQVSARTGIPLEALMEPPKK